MPKRKPRYFWWVWWSHLENSKPGGIIEWDIENMGIPNEPRALKHAHSALLRAGQAMYNAGLLKHPVGVQRIKTNNQIVFRLSLKN